MGTDKGQLLFEIEQLKLKLKRSMSFLQYVSNKTQANPMLFRLFEREKIAELIQFVKENTVARD